MGHLVIGSFDSSGRPSITVEVSGPLPQRTALTGVVDTGFAGFILIPMLQAFPIGLILHNTMPIVLADGSKKFSLVCLGTAYFEGLEGTDVVLVEEQAQSVLFGMDFLRRFDLELVVNPNSDRVELITSPAGAPAQGASPPVLPGSTP